MRAASRAFFGWPTVLGLVVLEQLLSECHPPVLLCAYAHCVGMLAEIPATPRKTPAYRALLFEQNPVLNLLSGKETSPVVETHIETPIMKSRELKIKTGPRSLRLSQNHAQISIH
jgi:hypothetical protein